jgi:hypothetical protein
MKINLLNPEKGVQVMTTKILALSLGVAMLSGIGIASADTVVGIGAQSKMAAQNVAVRLTDKQMDGITGGGLITTDTVFKPTKTPKAKKGTVTISGRTWS